MKIYTYEEIQTKIALLNTMNTDQNKVFNYTSLGVDGELYDIVIKFSKYSKIWFYTATEK